MTVRELDLEGVLLIVPDVHSDERGFFTEAYHAERYREAGISASFVQDNHSRSKRDVLRGLHFQRKSSQGKLVRVARGKILDVAVDIRPQSDTFGEHVAVKLDDSDHRQLWIPPGFAHGFLVLSEEADVLYKTTAFYDASDEGGIRWDDPELAIDWGIEDPILSDKDRDLPLLKDM